MRIAGPDSHCVSKPCGSFSASRNRIEYMTGELEELKRLAALGQLAAGVAHELNNPLGGILMYANLLLEDMPADDVRRENVRKIIRETERCRKIVQSLLNIARQTPPHCAPTDINATISEALKNVRATILARNIRVMQQFGELPNVFADGSQIQEVFENLIRNSAEALDGGGEIIISSTIGQTGNETDCVQITFSDTGKGIAPEHLEKLFEPFFTTKATGHGTGLGLAVSSSIVQRHKGTITAKNRPEGGAMFTVQLPVGGNVV